MSCLEVAATDSSLARSWRNLRNAIFRATSLAVDLHKGRIMGEAEACHQLVAEGNAAPALGCCCGGSSAAKGRSLTSSLTGFPGGCWNQASPPCSSVIGFADGCWGSVSEAFMLDSSQVYPPCAPSATLLSFMGSRSIPGTVAGVRQLLSWAPLLSEQQTSGAQLPLVRLSNFPVQTFSCLEQAEPWCHTSNTRWLAPTHRLKRTPCWPSCRPPASGASRHTPALAHTHSLGT